MFLGPVEPLGKTPEQKFHLSNDVLLEKRKKKKKKKENSRSTSRKNNLVCMLSKISGYIDNIN